MMRFNVLPILAMAALMAASASHAEAPKANHKPHMPAVVTDETPAAIQPAAGRNSFTEKQAVARLQDKGFSHISHLMVDNDGIWRGSAMMKNTKQRVAVDYQGNVTTD